MQPRSLAFSYQVLPHGPADLTYLTSWKGMGTARVTCTSGCECKPMDINAKVPMAVTSVFFNRLIVVRCQKPQCFFIWHNVGCCGPSNMQLQRDAYTCPLRFPVLGFATPPVPGARHHSGHRESGSGGKPTFYDCGCDGALRRSMSFMLYRRWQRLVATPATQHCALLSMRRSKMSDFDLYLVGITKCCEHRQ